MLAVAALVTDVLFVDPATTERHVVETVEGQRVGGQTVAAGAADLLIVGLNRGRHVGVRDKAHVRLVDAHAEGDGRDDDHAVLAQETVLVAIARLLIEPGVIGERIDGPDRENKRRGLRRACATNNRRCRFHPCAARENATTADAADPSPRNSARCWAGRNYAGRAAAAS